MNGEKEQKQQPHKKQYSTPQLVKYGNIVEMTKGGPGLFPEGLEFNDRASAALAGKEPRPW